MASVAEQPIQDPSWYRHRSLVVGLYWAAFLLFLLFWWVYVRNIETSLLIVVGIGVLAAAALGLAIWQTSVLLRSKGEPNRQPQELLPQRQLIGLILLAGSVVLAVLMLWLSLQRGLAAFPEVSSGIVLTLIGVGSGLALVAESGKLVQPRKLLDEMVENRRGVSIGLLLVGAAFLVTAMVLFLMHRDTVDEWYPQIFGALFLGVSFVGGGLWLLFISPEEVNVTNMRILVLVIGGAAGLIVALMTFVYMFRWRDVIFTGGTSTFHGDSAWRFWLSIYVELFGLVLMFGSLYLAHGDIRRNPVLRRLLYGYNAVFVGLLLLALLVVVNIAVYVIYPFNYNWTASQGIHALDNRSRKILEALDKNVTMYIVMSQGDRDFLDVRNLLENMRAYTPRIELREVSPDLDLREYEKLVERMAQLRQGVESGRGRGVLIVYGSENVERPAHEFISKDDLFEDSRMFHMRNPDEPMPPRQFKGESMVMTKLNNLMGGGEKKAVYFTQSNGELDITIDAQDFILGAGQLRQHLEKNNFDVRRLLWDTPGKDAPRDSKAVAYSKKTPEDAHRVPEDAKAVVIAWPKQPFTDDVLKALEEYMNRGGRLIVLAFSVDARNLPVETNLEGFLKKYGVEMEKDYMAVMAQIVDRRFVDTTVVAKPPPRSTNLIANSFAADNFFFDAPRTVRPATSDTTYRAEPLLVVSPRQGLDIWVDKEVSTLRNLPARVKTLLATGRLQEMRIREPHPVAVAVTDRDQTPRLVVFGDGRFISNAPVVDRTAARPPYEDLFTSSLEWLAGRPQNIGIAPRKTNYYRLRVPDDELHRLLLLSLSLVVLGLVGVGTGVWVVRRR